MQCAPVDLPAPDALVDRGGALVEGADLELHRAVRSRGRVGEDQAHEGGATASTAHGRLHPVAEQIVPVAVGQPAHHI